MPQTIDIPGVGLVQFPDSMSDADITAAAARLHATAATHAGDTPAVAHARARDARLGMGATPASGQANDRPLLGGSVILQNGADLLGGVRAGVASTVFHGGDLLRQGWNAVAPASMQAARIINEPDVQAAMTAPDSILGNVGKVGEQVAEFILPASVATSATSGMGLMARAGAQAATSGAVAATQKGDVRAAVVPAVVAGLAPVAGAGLQATARRVIGPALEKGAKRFARAIADDAVANMTAPTSSTPALPVPDAATLAREPETINAARRVLVDEALGVPRPSPSYFSLDQFRAAAAEAERTLAERGPTPTNWQELALWLAGGAASQNLKLGTLSALAAGARQVATHYPVQSGRLLYGAGRALLAPPTSGTLGGAASQTLTPADALQQMLLRRELNAEGPR